MAIFYILHSIYPPVKYTGDTYGQRNSRIFILGTILYILLWIWLKHLELTHIISSEYIDTIKACLWILIFADISVMAWLYKDFFNRNIIYELSDNDRFMYNKKNHKYIQKSNNLLNVSSNKKITNDKSSHSSIDSKINNNDNKNNDNEDIDNEDNKNKSKTILDSIKELKNNIINTITNDNIKENNKNDTAKDNMNSDDNINQDKMNKSNSESNLILNKEIETLNDLTSKMI